MRSRIAYWIGEVGEERDHAKEVLPRMSLVQDPEHIIIKRFDSSGDEQAAGIAKNGQVVAVIQKMFNLDRHIVGKFRPFAMKGLDHLDRMARPVEKVWISKGDVLGS